MASSAGGHRQPLAARERCTGRAQKFLEQQCPGQEEGEGGRPATLGLAKLQLSLR